MCQPIDLIIPWVDGNDPAWQQEKAQTVGLDGDQRVIRYRDWGFMKYWLRGVEKFLPWVRTVHLVTWGHLPPGLRQDHPKLHIVNHRDYIPPQFLPTFNCNVIELNFFRIPELAEQFILANDDTFFLRPMEPEFFFRNGLPVDAAIQNVLQFSRPDGIDAIVMNDLLALNMNFNKKKAVAANRSKWFNPRYGSGFFRNLYLMPFTNFTGFRDPHMPAGYLKSVFEEVYTACREQMESTFANKVRTKQDLNEWLCRYWQFAAGQFTPGDPHRGAFTVIGKDDERIADILKRQSEPMICLSDDDEKIDFEREQAFLTAAFEALLPEKSSFEL